MERAIQLEEHIGPKRDRAGQYVRPPTHQRCDQVCDQSGPGHPMCRRALERGTDQFDRDLLRQKPQPDRLRLGFGEEKGGGFGELRDKGGSDVSG